MHSNNTLTSKVITICLLAGVLLVPIFFLPWTSDRLDFNKQILFLILTLVAFLFWVGRGIIDKKLEVLRTPLDIPILVFVAVYLLSTLFSINWIQSVLGVSGSTLASLASVVLFGILYFVFVNNVNAKKALDWVLWLLGISASVVCLFFIVNVVGLPGLSKFFARSFNTIGSQLELLVFLAALFPVFGVFLLDRGKGWRSYLALIPLALTLVVFNLVNFVPGWIMLGITVFILMTLVIARYASIPLRTNWIWVLALALTLSIVSIFVRIPPIYNAGLPTEVSLGKNVSWEVANKTALSSPVRFLIGSGPGTFVNDFSKFRDARFNQNPFWQVRFNQAQNTVFELVATVGWLGFVTFAGLILIFLGSFIFFFFKGRGGEFRAEEGVFSGSIREKGEGLLLLIGLITAALSLIISFWFSLATFASLFLFWLLLSLVMKVWILDSPGEFKICTFSFKTSPKYSLVVSFGFLLGFTVLVLLLAAIARVYLGEYYYVDSVTRLREPEKKPEERLNGARVSIERALTYNPYIANYFLASANIALNQAAQRIQDQGQKVKADEISELLAQAINRSKAAVDLNPRDVATWETRGEIFRNTIPFTREVVKWAVLSFEEATKLEPTNPVLWNLLGLTQQVQSLDEDGKIADKVKFEEALKSFKKAVEVKADYVDGRVNLAYALERKGDTAGATATLKEGISSGRNAVVYYELGRFLYNKSQGGGGSDKDLKEAVQNLETAVQLNPAYSNALYSLGLAYERQGKVKEAIEKIEQVAKLNPTNEEIKKKLDQLKGKKPEEKPEEKK